MNKVLLAGRLTRVALKAGDRVVTQATFLIDAESNLKAALKGFAEPVSAFQVLRPSAVESRFGQGHALDRADLFNLGAGRVVLQRHTSRQDFHLEQTIQGSERQCGGGHVDAAAVHLQDSLSRPHTDPPSDRSSQRARLGPFR